MKTAGPRLLTFPEHDASNLAVVNPDLEARDSHHARQCIDLGVQHDNPLDLQTRQTYWTAEQGLPQLRDTPPPH